MYALQRVITIPSAKHEQAKQTWQQQILPHLQAQTGFEQAYLMQNGDNFVILMMWESATAFDTYHESPNHQEIHGWLHALKQGAVQKYEYQVLNS